MVVLIRQKSPGMKRARSCNARCYNAKHPNCACVCGGMNHSVGLEDATERTKDVKWRLVNEGKEVKVGQV